jgi:hypothetical protein
LSKSSLELVETTKDRITISADYPISVRPASSTTGQLRICSRNGGHQRPSWSPKWAGPTTSPGPSKTGTSGASSPSSTEARHLASHGNGITNPSTKPESHSSSNPDQAGGRDSPHATRATRKTRSEKNEGRTHRRLDLLPREAPRTTLV